MKVYSDIFSFTPPINFPSYTYSHINILIATPLLQLYLQPHPQFLSHNIVQSTSEGATHFLQYPLYFWVTKSLTTYWIGTKGGGNSYDGTQGGEGLCDEVEIIDMERYSSYNKRPENDVVDQIFKDILK